MFVPGNADLGLARIPLLPIDASTDAGDGVVAEGTFLSSRDITAKTPGQAGLRRTRTMRAYQLRARHRPTPQGVFAGVANIKPGDTDIRLGANHHPRSYPNPAWLLEACRAGLTDADVLRGLAFTANPLATYRGDRIEVESPANHDTPAARSSIRSTAATQLIMATCRKEAAWHDITAAIGTAWPAVPAATVEDTVRVLVRDGFLLTDLIADHACDDPVGHVLKRLPNGHHLHPRLSRMREALAEADSYTPGTPARAAALRTARAECDVVTKVARPIMVDVAADAHIQLPPSMGEAAARAANALWRTAISRDPFTGYHADFLERYGAHRLVPLREATDDVIGLGTTLSHRPHQASPQDEVLTALHHQAVSSGSTEVVIDDDTIASLDHHTPADRPPASAEISVQLLAANTCDLEAGKFFLAVSGMAQPGGATRGRFTTLLPTPVSTADDKTGAPMVAELVFDPRAHVARSLRNPAPDVPFRIRLGGQAREGDLPLDELALTSNGHQLLLWSTSHQRQVIPVHHDHIAHPLMPPLAAFLCQLGQHGTVPLAPWSREPVKEAPFTPRVRYGTTMLTPACWRLPGTLTIAASDAAQWANALAQWRRTTSPAPPSIVVTNDDDRQLPLHLDRDDDTELLRRYVHRGLKSVSEPLGGIDAISAVAPGPAGHHALEAVIPLASATHTPPRPVTTTPRAFSDGRHLPGGNWLSLAIRAHPTTQETVAYRVACLAVEYGGLWDRWFWLRYDTDALGPHLRVRFLGEPDILGGTLLPAINQLCTRLQQDRLSPGFVVETYDQEVERYGGFQAINAVEEVFWRDSELVGAILPDSADAEKRLALTAVSAAAMARTIAVSPDTALEPYRLGRTDRRVQARLKPLVRRLDAAAPAFAALWAARQHALATYAQTLTPQRRSDCASSLIHMHANRMLGDNNKERIARALAKDLIAREQS